MQYRVTHSFWHRRHFYGRGEIIDRPAWADGDGLDQQAADAYLEPFGPKTQPGAPVPASVPTDAAPAADHPADCGHCIPLPSLAELVDDRSLPVLAERGITNTAQLRSALTSGSTQLLGVRYFTDAVRNKCRQALGLDQEG